MSESLSNPYLRPGQPIRQCDECEVERTLVIEVVKPTEPFIAPALWYYASCQCGGRQPLDIDDRLALGLVKSAFQPHRK